jgi:hypothetical protein
VDLDGLGVNFQAFFFVYEEIFDSIALITLKLDDIASLFVIHDGSIAGKLLLDDFEDFL